MDCRFLLGYSKVPKMSLDKNRHGSDAPLLCHRGTSLNALRIDLKKKKRIQKGTNMR